MTHPGHPAGRQAGGDSGPAVRHGGAVRFNKRLLELAAHYHFSPRACAPARGSEKGAVERSVRYSRDSFFAARSFTTLEDLDLKLTRGLMRQVDDAIKGETA